MNVRAGPESEGGTNGARPPQLVGLIAFETVKRDVPHPIARIHRFGFCFRRPLSIALGRVDAGRRPAVRQTRFVPRGGFAFGRHVREFPLLIRGSTDRAEDGVSSASR